MFKNNQKEALKLLWSNDAYKISHHLMFTPGTTKVISNFTARGSRVDGIEETVFFGLQAYLLRIMPKWDNFFSLSEVELDEVLEAWDTRVINLTGASVGTDHLRALWEVGYLPLEFEALPEGSLVPLRVPYFTVTNTMDDFYWLPTTYFETDLSAHLWQPITTATNTLRLRELMDKYAVKAGLDKSTMDFQVHDFSYRGLTGGWAVGANGAAHLLSFSGSDTLPAEDFALEYYNGHTGQGSIPATEHSVMLSAQKEGEFDHYSYLLDTFPNGLLGIVSDTWNIWKVITEFLPALKEKIMARDGKLVIRPDSGDPELILCGDPDAEEGSPARRGVIGLLYDEFGGTEVNGYITLDSHIGAIYGDSITYDRADAILSNLMSQGFSPLSVVLGKGSYSTQGVTRDTFNMAMKATYAVVNGEPRDLQKDPITDSGTKKSAKGRLAVVLDDDGIYTLVEQATDDDIAQSELQPIWVDGEWLKLITYDEVKANIAEGLRRVR